jgi:type IV pilus assembly protein PilP
MRITALALAAGVVLVGCGRDTSDLEQYIEEVHARPASEIEPIPQMRTFDRVTYEPAGRRDPFTPDRRSAGLAGIAEEVTTEPPPDHDRAREPLEEFPLDGLRMVGTLELAGERWALVRDSEAIVHRVRAGNHMGRNYGRIVEIKENRIELIEQVPDGTGGWRERRASMALSD